MSKVKLKKPAVAVLTNGASKNKKTQHSKKNKRQISGKNKTQNSVKNKTQISGKKRTFFFPKPQTAKEETKPAGRNFMLPTNAQEISCNWKSLLQIIASNPENKTESSKQPKDVKGKQPQKTVSVSKDSQKPVKHFNKPSQSVKPAAERPGGQERGGDLRKGKDAPGHKQYKAEKRKRKDENKDKEKPMNKKRKIKEIEKQTTESDIWFDDVDPDDVEAAVGCEAADIIRKRNGLLKSDAEDTEKALVKEHGFQGLTRAVAMDCEMVGVGLDGEDSIVARVSIVNLFGKCIYDKYVKPTEKVTDYRTAVSGIRPEDIEHGEDMRTVQQEVADILKGRILVGHAIHNDLKILLLDHPKKMIRDTQKYKPFKERVKSGRPALRVLCKEILNVQVQKGEHSSVQDAQATMRLYTLVKKQWEAELKASRSLVKETKNPRKPKASKQQTN